MGVQSEKLQNKMSSKSYQIVEVDIQGKMNDDKLKSLEDKLKCLEESNSKCQKLKQLMATKVFWSDTSNENLETLLKLGIEKLFERYEQIMKIKTENVEFKET